MSDLTKNTQVQLVLDSSSEEVDVKPLNNVAKASDVELFNAEMYKTPVVEQSVADKVIAKFSGVSEDLAKQRSLFEEKLKKAAKTGDNKDIMIATQAMSDYYLQASISAKVVGKATSALDRLTNLQ